MKGDKEMNGQTIKILERLDFSNDIRKRAKDPKKIINDDFFEKRRFPYFHSFLLMWLIIVYVLLKKTVYKILFRSKPKINSIFFDGLGPWSKKVKDGAASWKALDIIYNHPFKKTNTLASFVDEFWWFSQNCQAVRNRFKLVKQEVTKAIMHFGANGREVRIVSLACGSAQAIIEVVAKLKEEGINIKVLLIDIEQEALDYAKHLVKENRVEGQVEFIKANAYQTARILRDFQPHIVEMLGLLDYLSKENAIRLISSINKSLVPGGLFLACNIRSNSERYFVTWVIDWKMVYRSPADLKEVIEKSGFNTYRIIYEPLKIHGVVVAKKSTII
jgi:SAM-dependent methyltransferase